MNKLAWKPIGIKAYGHIPHLPGSRVGPGDHTCAPGQARIATEKVRDKHDLVIVQEKLDGCLVYNTKIMTDSGEIAIGKIVNQKLPVYVLTYNENTRSLEYKSILAYHHVRRTRPWYRITVRTRTRGCPERHLTCTDNHRFLTQDGWKEAKALSVGQTVYVYGERISYEAKQIILGGLLGDSSISCPSIENQPTVVFGHSDVQLGYFEFKLHLLGGIAHEVKGFRGGFDGSQPNHRAYVQVTPHVIDIIETYCLNMERKKQVSVTWANELTPLALAIWYMDDGSCRFTTEQRPRAYLATNGFSFDEAELLSAILKTCFGVDNGVFDYKGPTIVMTADGTERFFSLIYPFVPSVMKYKLPDEYRSRCCVLDGIELPTNDGILATTITSIDDNAKAWQSPNVQYDLTIADNHNYFAAGTLVHNSCVAVTLVDGEVLALGRAGYLAQTSPFEQHRLFAAWVRENEGRFRAVLHEGERLCGEWLAQAHGTRYMLFHEPFVAFDLMVGHERSTYARFWDRVGMVFPTPRVVHVGEAFSVADAMAEMEPRNKGYHGHHGALDPVEGAMWRVERETKGVWAVDFLVKYVKPGKVDGCYLPEVSGEEPVWNWRP